MDLSEGLTSAIDVEVQSVILAAAQHDVPRLQTLLKETSANVQDPETGQTPLHAAILACEDTQAIEINGAATNEVGQFTNGDSIRNGHDDAKGHAVPEAAVRTVKFLLQNGAIWNDVDRNNETPGCIALRLGQQDLYAIMVDAGVRAELLLSRLDEYERLEDSVSDRSETGMAAKDDAQDAPPTRTTDELSTELHQVDPSLHRDAESREYLSSELEISDSRILDSAQNGVMMAWESSIMRRSVSILTHCPNPRILNIGYGMGIIDKFFQETAPSSHHIIEAHPNVLTRMRQEGWYEKSNVTVHEGKWQDVVPKIIEQAVSFDIIYFDTFAEDYKALRDFFSDHLIGLLDDAGKWSFFNGLGADRQICYDVYQKVVEMDLFEAGFETEWETMQTPESDQVGEWSGVRRKYWTLKEYRLPICTFMR